jgi:hypothetical protein
MPSAAAVVLGMAVAMASSTAPASGQTFEAVGTRAAGMGGAFVAVADDASAVYWNPAGLVLGGSLFSLTLDTNQGDAESDANGLAGRQSGSLVALSTPPLGLSYYRLAATRLAPSGVDHVQRLVTHNAGVTLVQSFTSSIAIATTLRVVRGVASAGTTAPGDRDDLLDNAVDLPNASKTTFDADIGIMASLGKLRAGLTARNLREPEFPTAGTAVLELRRQTRAGIAYVGTPGLIVSADLDLERAVGSIGELRNFAAGAEAHILPRAFVRTGFRVNTLSDQPGGHAPLYSLGAGIVTVRSLIVDAQITLGSKFGDRGWGVAGRIVY